MHELGRLHCDDIANGDGLVAGEVLVGLHDDVEQSPLVAACGSGAVQENSPLAWLYLVESHGHVACTAGGVHVVDSQTLRHGDVELHSRKLCVVAHFHIHGMSLAGFDDKSIGYNHVIAVEGLLVAPWHFIVS